MGSHKPCENRGVTSLCTLRDPQTGIAPLRKACEQDLFEACFLLGMELPTPVAYVIMFVTVVPLMIDAGVDQLAANFFAFYFAILSTLTPPVALSVLAASRIAGSGFLETCKHSIRLSIVGYLLPFAMAFTPMMLGFPDKIGTVGWTAIGILVLSSIAGGAGMYGYFLRPLGPLTRSVHLAAALVGLGYDDLSGIGSGAIYRADLRHGLYGIEYIDRKALFHHDDK